MHPVRPFIYLFTRSFICLGSGTSHQREKREKRGRKRKKKSIFPTWKVTRGYVDTN